MDTRSTDIVMKILIDLNVRERITMIMVTHDVGLKFFAHRVVRMNDGKVARIDTIPQNARTKIISELEERVDAIQAGSDGNVLTIREGISAAAVAESNNNEVPSNFNCLLENNRTSKTSVRKVKDYPILQERFAGNH